MITFDSGLCVWRAYILVGMSVCETPQVCAEWRFDVTAQLGESQPKREFKIVLGRFQCVGIQESTRRAFLRRSGSPRPKRASTAAWVLVHSGTARASNFFPFGVSSSRRARWSPWPVVILVRRRRCSGFRAAVNVV